MSAKKENGELSEQIARAAAERIAESMLQPSEAIYIVPIIEAALAESAKERDAEVERLRLAFTGIRDSVLNERYQLAEAGLDNDQVNAVLGIIDDAIPPPPEEQPNG
jgi:hypothetical protein